MEPEEGFSIQLPPPMPLLLASTSNAAQILNGGSEKITNSASSSPTGAHASNSDINDESVCSASSSCSSQRRRHADSGINSTDDVSRGADANSATSPNSLTQQSNTRPVSPALSHTSFGLESKFQILTEIPTTNPRAPVEEQPPGPILPGRYFSGTTPRSVRASTPTTARRIVNPALLQGTENIANYSPYIGLPSRNVSSTLPRHHVVHISQEQQKNERLSDDDTSSSDEEDARIFSSNLRHIRAPSNKSRNNKRAVSQPSQIHYLPQHIRHHQLSTIPEQMETSVCVQSNSGLRDQNSASSSLALILSLVYALLLCALSVAFFLQPEKSTESPLSAEQGFTHFLLVGSLIVVALVGYKRLASSSAPVTNVAPTVGVNKRSQYLGRRSKRSKKESEENSKDKLLSSSSSTASTSSTSSNSSTLSRGDFEISTAEADFEALKKIERGIIAAVCALTCLAKATSFGVSLRWTLSGIQNNKSPCGFQAISIVLTEFWQFLLTPALGYLLLCNSKAPRISKSPAIFGIGFAHLISSQFHSVVSRDNFLSTANCTNLEGDQKLNTIIYGVASHLAPMSRLAGTLFSIFACLILARWLFGRRKSEGHLVSMFQSPVIASLQTGNYSWGRLCAITVGCLLMTISAIWNLAIIAATLNAKVTEKESILVVLVASTSSTSSVEEIDNNLGPFLSIAGDGITVGILAISLVITITCAVVTFVKSSDGSQSKADQGKSSPKYLINFFMVTSSSILFLHFSQILTWTSESISPPSLISVWLCYTHLIHVFVQTISTVMCEIPAFRSSNRCVRSLFMLNAFANMSLFITVLLKNSSQQGAAPQLMTVVEAFTSAHYLVAAFILFRLAR